MRVLATGIAGVAVGVLLAAGIAYGEHGVQPPSDTDFWDGDAHGPCGELSGVVQDICEELERVSLLLERHRHNTNDRLNVLETFKDSQTTRTDNLVTSVASLNARSLANAASVAAHNTRIENNDDDINTLEAQYQENTNHRHSINVSRLVVSLPHDSGFSLPG